MTVNIEINDVVPDVLLTVYGEWQTFQEKVPKLSFRIGHVVAEIFCEGDKLFVMVKWHRCNVVVIGLTEQSAMLLGDPHPSPALAGDTFPQGKASAGKGVGGG